MFEVHSVSPLDDEWEERDVLITEAAGRRSDFGGSGNGQRDHGWYVSTFEEAQVLKGKLDLVLDVQVTVRETISHERTKKRKR